MTNAFDNMLNDVYNEFFGDLEKTFRQFDEAEKKRKQKKNTCKGVTKEELDKVLHETYQRYCVF